jgi:hypothetical protein
MENKIALSLEFTYARSIFHVNSVSTCLIDSPGHEGGKEDPIYSCRSETNA